MKIFRKPGTEAIWQALSQVMDPEFGISIVELGLIYDVCLKEDAAEVTMTLTTPSCPAGAMLVDAVKYSLLQVTGNSNSEVALVWDPEWNPDMISEQAREQLGW